MKLKLHNFMKHEDYAVEFRPGKVTLITGESENGKSSILYAIQWCLYGGVQKVYREKSGQKDKKVWVNLEINDLKIYRQAKPGKLNVKNRNASYAGNAAQEQINEAFGSKELWLACSFVEQKKMCYLMETSIKDRMKILRLLAFDEENPEKYINKIELEKQKEKDKYKEALIEYGVKKKIFDEKVSGEGGNKFSVNNRRDLNWDILMEKADKKLKRTEEKLVMYRSEIVVLESKNLEYERVLVRKGLYKGQLDDDEKKLAKIGLPLTKKDLEKMKRVVTQLTTANINYKIYQKRSKVRGKLEKKRKKYKNRLDAKKIDLKYINQKTYIKTIKDEQNYKLNVELADGLKLEYRMDSIKEQILVYEVRIDQYQKYKKFVEILKRLKKFEDELKKLGGEGGKENIEDLQKSYRVEKEVCNNMRFGLKLLVCPFCDGCVSYKHGHLVKSDKKAASQEDYEIKKVEIKVMLEKIEKVKRRKILEENIDELSKKIEDRVKVENYKYGSGDLQKWITFIGKLNQIDVVEEPKISSKQIKNAIRYYKVLLKLKDFEGGEEEVSQVSDDELRVLKSKYESSLERKRKYDELIEKRGKTKTNLGGLVLIDVRDDYKIKKEMIGETEKKCGEIKTKIQKLKLEKDLDVLLVVVEKRKRFLDILDVLYKKANDLSCQLLENTVATINDSVNPILSKIFDKLVRVDLKLFKKLKTGNKIKQSVNIDVFFDAEKHEKRFCGGEQDRLSMAVLLALNSLSRSPFIMMDELMGTVSNRIVEKCIKQIKGYITSEKYVLCVEHRMVDGLYDDVIKVVE